MTTSGNSPAVLLSDKLMVSVSPDMYEYLCLEAARRGVSLTQVYREEAQAIAELKRRELPREQLEKAAKRDYSNHPWLVGDQEKPF